MTDAVSTEPAQDPQATGKVAAAAPVYPEDAPWPAARTIARRLAFIGAGVLCLSALMREHVPICPFVAFAGIPCPGCGLTRATICCLRGEFADAFLFHPLVFVAAPATGAMVAFILYSYVKMGKVRFSPRVSSVLTPPMKWIYVAMLALWIARFFGFAGGPVDVKRSIFSALYHLRD